MSFFIIYIFVIARHIVKCRAEYHALSLSLSFSLTSERETLAPNVAARKFVRSLVPRFSGGYRRCDG